MTSRDKKLAILLGIVAGGGLLLLLWQFVLSPWQDSRAAAKKLELEFAEKNSKLDDLIAKAPKLEAYKKRSLPGDVEIARGEYEALLTDLVRQAKVPGGYTISTKVPGDDNKVLLLAAKQPAFTRVGSEIVLRNVDMPTLVRFLQAYYRQPLLQQITRFVIKKSGTVESSAKSGSRSDLEVTIDTEAVIIDGAEKRRTLLPVSMAYGGLNGGLGLGLLHNEPGPARHFTPAGVESLLAPGNRDYATIAAKDAFHGPLPTPAPPKKKEETKEPDPVPPPAPKEDISPFIRLNGITWRSDGTVTAEIHDAANRYDYLVERKLNLSLDMAVRVKKLFYLNNVTKPLETFDDLVIAEDGTATDRQFKVLDFLPDGLLLKEMHPAAKIALPDDDAPDEEKPKEKEDPKAKGSTSGKTGNRNVGKSYGNKGGTTTTTKKASPAATDTKKPTPGAAMGALVGAGPLAPAAPAAKTYLWRIGYTLNKLEEQTATPAEPPAKEIKNAKDAREVTPPPRAAKDGR